MRAVILALFLACPAIAAAQAPATVEIQLSSFDFTPSAIHLQAGHRVTLHLVNSGNGGHNFAAPEFFAAATGVSGPVANGTIEVRGHQSVDVTLTPAAGAYHLRCTHTMHSAFGMRGEITVD